MEELHWVSCFKETKQEVVGEGIVAIMWEILERTRAENPVRGNWYKLQLENGTIWYKDSSTAIGIVLEIRGVKEEDTLWLRKADDYNYINVDELNTVLKERILALKSGLHYQNLN